MMNNSFRMLTLATMCIAAPALAAGCAAQEKAPAKPQAKTAAKAPAKRPFPAALLTPEKLKEKAPETFDVKFETTKGDFVIRVTRAWAPQGADRFYNLVKNHYYDGAAFFRVIPGFVVQFGLSAYPEVAAVWSKSTISDDPVTQSNTPGFVTYAMAGPNTRTTQLFINLGENDRLDPMGFAPFGQVVEGMDVVEQIHSGYGDAASRGGKGPHLERRRRLPGEGISGARQHQDGAHRSAGEACRRARAGRAAEKTRRRVTR
jgi:peptidyl-prolyl cis-trans isomerase A (cyclophilin A)